MTLFSSCLWLCVAAYGIHVLEEFLFDWKSWARNVLDLPAEWKDFYVTNALVIVIGIVAAIIAPRWPLAAAGYPSLMLINALGFHIAPFCWTRGRFSPGMITAVCLFLPLGVITMRAASLNLGSSVAAAGIGAFLMALPIVFLKMAAKPYFNQDK